jgi:hypothetical protein
MFSKSYDMLKSGGPGVPLSVLTILNRCTSVVNLHYGGVGTKPKWVLRIRKQMEFISIIAQVSRL